MQGLELVVILGATIFAGGYLAGKLRIATPLVLLVMGAGLGFIPYLGEIQLPPDLVLLLFLPALLYWDSLNTSFREIRANIRIISLLAVGLVFLTALVVAVIAHAFGLPWSISIALGAILAPTDATAVSSVAGRLPRRTLAVLRGESLINDGTALVLYAVAVSAAVAENQIPLGATVVRFFASYGLGIAIGLVVGLIVVGIRTLLDDRLLENTLSVLTPFAAYLPAEALGVSGVVSVVTAGLTLSRAGPRVISASARTQAYGFWQVTTYLLNGALFVLIGFELHRVAGRLDSQWELALALSVAAIVAILAVRIILVTTMPLILRVLPRHRGQLEAPSSLRNRFPTAWAGFRGAVSLAAALALPAHTASGENLPGRDVAIAVTFAVILFTLLVQGLTMPVVIRLSGLTDDPDEFDEELLAEQVSIEAALAALDDAAKEIGATNTTTRSMRRGLESRLKRIHREEGDPLRGRRDEDEHDRFSALRLALLPARREAVVQLRDENRIDDTVLRRMQAQIDLEELGLADAEDDH